jgi:hypothetical protein
MTMDGKIIRADRKLRKNLILFVTAALIMGLISIFYFQSFLQDLNALAKSDPEQALARALQLLHTVNIVNAIVLSLFALYFLQFFVLTYGSAQYPPPGVRVFKDRKVILGKGARIRGVVGVAIALVLFGLAYSSAKILSSMETKLKDKTAQKESSLVL